MNTMQRAVGMGFVHAGEVTEGSNRPSGFNWQRVADSVATFGTSFLTQWGNRGVARAGINPFSLQQSGGNNTPNNTASAAQAEYEAELRRRREEELASGSISSKGIKVGDTTITWPVIAIFGAGVYLLQSQGFSRKSGGRY